MSETNYTHYLPIFVEAHWPRAVCGLSSRFQTLEHSVTPSCPRCAAWLEADVTTAKALEALWAAEPAGVN